MFQFRKLKADKTSADWAARVPELEAAVEMASETLDGLERQRQDTVLSGDEAAIAKLSAEIGAARENLANLKAALVGARRRHDEAVTGEKMAVLESGLKAFEALKKRSKQQYEAVLDIGQTRDATLARLEGEFKKKISEAKAKFNEELSAAERELAEISERADSHNELAAEMGRYELFVGELPRNAQSSTWGERFESLNRKPFTVLSSAWYKSLPRAQKREILISTGVEDWAAVLDVAPDADWREIDNAYRTRCFEIARDGGDPVALERVRSAFSWAKSCL